MVKRMFFNLHMHSSFIYSLLEKRKTQYSFVRWHLHFCAINNFFHYNYTLCWNHRQFKLLAKKKWKKKKVKHWELNCWQFWQRKWLADFGFKPNRKPVGHCRRYLFSRSKSRICFRICLALSWSYLQIRIHMCSDEQPGDKECLHMEIFPGGS